MTSPHQPEASWHPRLQPLPPRAAPNALLSLAGARLAALLLLLVGSACSPSDPCGTVGGLTCLTMRIEGRPEVLDAIRVDLYRDGEVIRSRFAQKSEAGEARLKLPAQFALTPPSPLVEGTYQFKLYGFVDGRFVSAGESPARTAPPLPRVVEITLSPISADGDGGPPLIDLAAAADLASSTDLSLSDLSTADQSTADLGPVLDGGGDLPQTDLPATTDLSQDPPDLSPPSPDMVQLADMTLPSPDMVRLPDMTLPSPDMAQPPCGASSCAIFALHPAVPATNEELVLEGRFPGDLPLTVTFAGAAQTVAVQPGQQGRVIDRILVRVPQDALSGTLTVSLADGTALASVTYRPTSFSQRLRVTSDGPDQANAARLAPRLVDGRMRHEVVTTDRYLYVLGGDDVVGFTSQTERAPIHADGSLGPFEPQQGLMLSRHSFAVARVGKVVYLVGGITLNGWTTSILRSTIDPATGQLGPFTNSGVALLTPRAGHAVEVIGQNLYVIGGTSNGVSLSSVEQIPLNADGSLATPTAVAGVTLGTARSYHRTAVIGNRLLVVGGTAGAVEQSTISDTGALGPFTGFTLFNDSELVGLIAPRLHVSATTLWVLGGSKRDDVLGPKFPSSFEVNPIQGVQPALTLHSSLVTASRIYHATALVGNQLYHVGGRSGDGVNFYLLRSLESASFAGAPPSASAFSTIGPTVPSNTLMAAALGSHLYAFAVDHSNATPQLNVQRAEVNADGRLGAFSAHSSVDLSMVGSLDGARLAFSRKHLYLIGPADKALAYTLNPDGSLPTTPMAVSLFTPSTGTNTTGCRYCSVAFLDTGDAAQLRLLGGDPGLLGVPTASTDIRYSAIDSSTSLLKPFNQPLTPSPFGSTGTSHSAGVYLGSVYYLLGGLPMDTNDYSLVFSSAGILSLNAKPSPFGFRYDAAAVTFGNLVALVGGYTALGGSPVATLEPKPFGRGGLVQSTTDPVIPSLQTARARPVALVLGNYLYVLGGVDANGKPLSSIERILLK